MRVFADLQSNAGRHKNSRAAHSRQCMPNDALVMLAPGAIMSTRRKYTGAIGTFRSFFQALLHVTVFENILLAPRHLGCNSSSQLSRVQHVSAAKCISRRYHISTCSDCSIKVTMDHRWEPYLWVLFDILGVIWRPVLHLMQGGSGLRCTQMVTSLLANARPTPGLWRRQLPCLPSNHRRSQQFAVIRRLPQVAARPQISGDRSLRSMLTPPCT